MSKTKQLTADFREWLRREKNLEFSQVSKLKLPKLIKEYLMG